MLLWIDRLLSGSFGFDLVLPLERIMLRASLAAALSFALALALGPRCIAWLQSRFREPNKSASVDVARLHAGKAAMPTMGGIFILGGLVAGVLAFSDWANPYVQVTTGLTLALAVLGAADDWIKLRTTAPGIRARSKLLFQTLIAAAAVAVVYHQQAHGDRGVELWLPLVGRTIYLDSWCFIPWGAFVIVGSSNAVNLADGLDGLAGGCLVCAAAALAVVVYASGHAGWSSWLAIPHVEGAGELTIVAAAMAGSLLGFLWFNCHPASVFMGDVGSLPLGGLLGLLALIARQELLWAVIGGVFVAEAASVILQVAFYRWRKRRLLLCAPLHHHFQIQGWGEGKIVVRFWIAAALCAIVGLAALKSRSADPPGWEQFTAFEH
ncbi:MAG TPA: phospho-N-acetylmuramoyl-pentapeptide-transferase [Pirellulales bacterium]|nr:phospho-N-acetylmuramoyl-pentapeptide-transferase [Pirellulales bacterium]